MENRESSRKCHGGRHHHTNCKGFVAAHGGEKKRKSLVGCIEREIKSKGRKEDENQHNKRENAKENLNKHVGSTLKKKARISEA